MLTKVLQRSITSKGVRKVYRFLTGIVLDMSHEGLRRDRLRYLGIDPNILLQQYKDDAFASSKSAPLPLTRTPKVEAIHHNLTRKLTVFKFSGIKEVHSQSLAHPVNGLERSFAYRKACIDIATSRLYRNKQTTKNTLATIQKVDRTTKNRMSTNNHKYLQGYNSYENP